METITSEIIFSKIKYYENGKAYINIKGENNIFTLFHISCVSDIEDEEDSYYVEVYYLYKNGEFVKSFALNKTLVHLTVDEREMIIGEFYIESTFCRGLYHNPFEEIKYHSMVNSIFPNSHLFNLKLISPEEFYLEAKSIL